jgi:hypothetical protein
MFAGASGVGSVRKSLDVSAASHTRCITDDSACSLAVVSLGGNRPRLAGRTSS